jgi:hypothetical protein
LAEGQLELEVVANVDESTYLQEKKKEMLFCWKVDDVRVLRRKIEVIC